jgi:branched-chain amino acid transport system permease protein
MEDSDPDGDRLLALQLVTGIALGAVYALLALGLSLIFGMLTVVNFAHGAFFMVGAFVGLYFMGLTGNFWFSLVLTPLVVGAIGLVTERFLVRPLYGRGIDYPLLLTFGLSWVLIEAMRVLFGIEGTALVDAARCCAARSTWASASFPSTGCS